MARTRLLDLFAVCAAFVVTGAVVMGAW